MTLRWLGQEPVGLPSCYSQEFDACIDAYRTKQPAELSAFCSRYYELWKNTPEASWNAAMDKMPICATEKPEKKSDLIPFAAGMVAGAVLAFLWV